ncbi:MAG: hypothetical protein N4A64_09560 [Marinisporobacter sp.]|jgi:hypothetical protein|nr:hypothetical protein [Marinisporobacter sp.]
MKKIINGRMYNTDTAKYIGEYTNGYFPDNGYYIGKELYRKKTGEFFLYRQGGGLTEYAVRYGNGSSGSSTIIPLTFQETKEWVEEYLDADIYIELFGEPEE